MDAAVQIPPVMSLREFLAWDAPWGQRWQLVDGKPRAMAPTSRTHGTIQSTLTSRIDRHLRERDSQCVIVTTPGVVPRVRSESNFRIPDLAVTCTPYQDEQYDLANPVLIIEILSPSNRAETWTNIWAYATIPSVHEILIVHSTKIGAELLRRDTAGNWPEQPIIVDNGVLELRSIGFSIDVAALYQGTRLAIG